MLGIPLSLQCSPKRQLESSSRSHDNVFPQRSPDLRTLKILLSLQWPSGNQSSGLWRTPTPSAPSKNHFWRTSYLWHTSFPSVALLKSIREYLYPHGTLFSSPVQLRDRQPHRAKVHSHVSDTLRRRRVRSWSPTKEALDRLRESSGARSICPEVYHGLKTQPPTGTRLSFIDIRLKLKNLTMGK